MLDIRTYLNLDTSISMDNSNIENWEEYANYINNEVYSRILDIDKKFIVQTNYFGNIEVILKPHDCLEDDEGKFVILIKMTVDNNTIDEDIFYNKFSKDTNLINSIVEHIIEYADEINERIKDIKHPLNENLIYKNENLYMELHPLFPKYEPTIVSLSLITNNINTDQLNDYLSIHQK